MAPLLCTYLACGQVAYGTVMATEKSVVVYTVPQASEVSSQRPVDGKHHVLNWVWKVNAVCPEL